MVDDLIQQIARQAATDQVAHLESRIKFLEERLANLQRQPDLLTEKEAGRILGVCPKTMWNWRQGRHPVIEFIEYPGGGIRYSREAVERFLKGCERGKKATLRAA